MNIQDPNDRALPLQIERVKCLDPDGPHDTLGILDANSIVLLRHDAWESYRAPWVHQNCEFIVRACNNHEALLKACGGLVWLGNNMHQYGTPDFEAFLKAAISDARAAYNQAKGQP